MEHENTLAKRITTAGVDSSYDEACKKLLANKKILAWIMKTCVEEFHNYSINEIEEKYIEGTPEIAAVTVHQDETGEFIHGINTEDSTMMEGTISFDIRFQAIAPLNGNMIGLILNVEAQNDFYPGYPLVKRGIYYGSRLISAQYGIEFSDSHYEKIKKVYSIWICINPPEYRKNTIVSYSFRENNLIGRVKEKKENYDLITVVMVCLGKANDNNYVGLLKMLDILLSSEKKPEEKKQILQDEFDIVMTKSMEREVSDMCNLSKGVYDRAILDALRNLMDSTGWTLDKCMEVLKVPESQQVIYRSML